MYSFQNFNRSGVKQSPETSLVSHYHFLLGWRRICCLVLSTIPDRDSLKSAHSFESKMFMQDGLPPVSNVLKCAQTQSFEFDTLLQEDMSTFLSIVVYFRVVSGIYGISV